MDDSELVAQSDLIAIGNRIVEMADRLKIDSVVPGMVAQQVIVLDGERFTIIVRRGEHREQNDG